MVSALRPVTCLLEGSEDDTLSLPERKWSSLPFLLLWMIIDRLDFFDNAKVAQVCRHWRQASINKPTKLQTVGDGMPWIMLGAYASDVREFINVERTKKFAVELPEFYCSSPLFSRQGWILLERNKVCREDRVEDSLFLINPLTKCKIKVGDVVIDGEGSEYRLTEGCFSNSKDDGFPNCVVICYTDNEDDYKIRLYITYLSGDQVWTKQSYVVKERFIAYVDGMTVINSHVYISCQHGDMIIYDMGVKTWKEIQGPSKPNSNQPRLHFRDPHLMERKGGIFIFAEEGSWFFYKYSQTHNCWQRLGNDDDDDANNMMMFGIRGTSYYLTADIQKGLYAYEIIKERREIRLSYYDYLLDKCSIFEVRDAPYLWVDLLVDDLWVDIG